MPEQSHVKTLMNFEVLFKKCHDDLTKKERQLRPFVMEQQIEKGMFFVLKGMLVYVAEMGERVRSKKKKMHGFDVFMKMALSQTFY